MSNYIYLNCTVLENTLATSKEKGTPSVKLKLQYADADKNLQTIDADLWLSDKASEKTFKTLYDVFGWAGKLSELLNPILSGKKCVAACEYEEYKGKNYLRAKYINRESKPVAKANAGIVAQLESKFSGIAANQAAKARAEGVKFEPEKLAENPDAQTPLTDYSGRPDNAPTITDDDLPF